MNLTLNNYYILTGAPGTGKSSLIQKLRSLGYVCVDEPAREVIAQQKAINGDGTYEKNPQLFVDLMLDKSINNFKLHQQDQTPVIFDRAIPDIIAYAHLSGNDATSYLKAATEYRYNNKIFYLPIWDEIYVNDQDRKMSLDHAKRFDQIIRQVYADLGYEIINIPLTTIDERADYIINFFKHSN